MSNKVGYHSHSSSPATGRTKLYKIPHTNMFNFLSSGTQPKPSVDSGKKAPVRALPAAWYTTREMYEFERRVIFSRQWLFLTHSSRLQQPGDFLRYTVAGYDFVVLMDRTNKINAFHNVCRHRAYTVVEKDQGRASILSCRYHGWSYGLNGKLAKAPDYDTLKDFDKSQMQEKCFILLLVP